MTRFVNPMNPKNELQECYQKMGLTLPRYESTDKLIQPGNTHEWKAKVFFLDLNHPQPDGPYPTVVKQGRVCLTKKNAEQDAAEIALLWLRQTAQAPGTPRSTNQTDPSNNANPNSEDLCLSASHPLKLSDSAPARSRSNSTSNIGRRYTVMPVPYEAPDPEKRLYYVAIDLENMPKALDSQYKYPKDTCHVNCFVSKYSNQLDREAELVTKCELYPIDSANKNAADIYLIFMAGMVTQLTQMAQVDNFKFVIISRDGFTDTLKQCLKTYGRECITITNYGDLKKWLDQIYESIDDQ